MSSETLQAEESSGQTRTDARNDGVDDQRFVEGDRHPCFDHIDRVEAAYGHKPLFAHIELQTLPDFGPDVHDVHATLIECAIDATFTAAENARDIDTEAGWDE